MLKLNSFNFWALFCIIILVESSCQTKIVSSTNKPLGASLETNGSLIPNRQQVLSLIVSSYSLLGYTGYTDSNAGYLSFSWSSAPDNWSFGSVCSDDSHKGSTPGDQPDLLTLEQGVETSTNSYVQDVWNKRYTGIWLANSVLRTMRKATDITPDDTTEFGAEARFLRGYYHFDLKKIFGNVSYVDENANVDGDTITVPNTQNIWPYIEADLKYAYNNLPETQVGLGRANKWAAAAFLAKAYVYEGKWSEALPLFHTIMSQGVNPQGIRYGLLTNFEDNFNPAKNHEDDPELVFAVQYYVNDGSEGGHANQGDELNFPYAGGPGQCCGFNQPSYSLVNAFKVNSTTGLPLIGASEAQDTYNNADLKNDEGISTNSPYTPDGTTPVDPRLDWTVGRRGIPYLDWGVMPGDSWTRDQSSGGPYLPIKNTFFQSQLGIYSDNSSWTPSVTANNTMLMRYADLLLLAAEAEVEAGSLESAQQLVNRVRSRAANPATWVQGSPAHYMIGTYPAGYFASQGQAYARHAVQFERRLELAMEGHRFFDLVRYGTAIAEINAYIQHESNVSGYTLLTGSSFATKNELFPIPASAIALSVVNGQPTLVQNPGY